MRNKHRDPITRFRVDIMSILFGLIALISCLQFFRGSIHSSALTQRWSTAAIGFGALLALILVRTLRRIQGLAAFGLILILTLGAVLDFQYGHHSFNPFLLWTSFIVFAGFLVNDRRMGRILTVFALTVGLILTFGPTLVGFQAYSFSATPEAFRARVSLAIVLIFLIPWTMTYFFEKLLRKTRADVQSLQAEMEKQRNKTLLAHFANHIAEDLSTPLHRLEQIAEQIRVAPQKDLRDQLSSSIQAAKLCIERMGSITDRYRQLSLPSQLLSEQGTTLREFLNSIKVFSLGSNWEIHGALTPETRLRGDHIVTLQLILCLGLMNAQSLQQSTPICLEVERKEQQLCFAFLFAPNNFLQEIQLLLQDMQGSIEHVDSYLHINIPLSRIS